MYFILSTTEKFRVMLSTDGVYEDEGMTWTKAVEDTLVSVKAFGGGCEPDDDACCAALPGMTFQFEEQQARSVYHTMYRAF